MSIGTLKKVELREIWPREDTDFTKWLNDNLSILGEAIGLDLEGSETESCLDNSKLRIDIIATTKEGEKIIIENQLEQTDHKHLGQIMTYIINIEAKVAVWIAKTVREEHINAIRWLNEFTDKDFYLIQLESYRIEDSKPAPFLKVICQPSKEMKEVGKQKAELSNTSKLKKDFWKSFLNNRREKTDLFSNATPTWWTVIEHPFHKDINLACHINKNKGGIAVRFEAHLKDLFLKLAKDWKSKLGFDLKIDKMGNAGMPSTKYQLIKWFDKGGYSNPERWDQIQEEMINNMIKLEKLLQTNLDKFESLHKVA